MPKITRVNEEGVNINGSCYMGKVIVDYATLVEKFGPPKAGWDGYKTDVEWHIEFEDGNIATIYNWKDGHNYCGEKGLHHTDIKEWHIGGHHKSVTTWITDYIYNAWPAFDEVRQEAQF
tara:strand:+ start:182 stop:538 length:357 start_codon:yes stop_codon:yes gene_type:complete